MEPNKNPNFETAHVLQSPISPLSQDHVDISNSNKTHEDERMLFKNGYEMIKKVPNSLSCSSVAVGEGATPPAEVAVVAVEESGRERLKRHRVEMAGQVWIPDIWGHEDLLKDWIDCNVFDSSLGNKSIMSARSALIQERRAAAVLRIQNQC